MIILKLILSIEILLLNYTLRILVYTVEEYFSKRYVDYHLQSYSYSFKKKHNIFEFISSFMFGSIIFLLFSINEKSIAKYYSINGICILYDKLN